MEMLCFSKGLKKTEKKNKFHEYVYLCKRIEILSKHGSCSLSDPGHAGRNGTS